MDFKKSREKYRQLAERYRQGRITGEDFANAVDDLAVTDKEGQEWKIGLQSGKWYRKEGDQWLEDSPAVEKSAPIPARPKETPAEKRVRRIVFGMVMVVLVAGLCLGSFYFMNDGALFSLDIFGDGGAIAGGPSGEESAGDVPGSGQDNEGQDSLDDGGNGDAGDSPTMTVAPEGEAGPGQETPEADAETAEDAPAEPTAQPTPTFTATPPAPETPPQIWQMLSENILDDINAFTGEWSEVPERDWEYEVLNYRDVEALFLQFDEEENLFYTGEQLADDIERSLRFALPDEDGVVNILCRWQDDSGYALSLTNQRWRLLKIEQGASSVLADGSQVDAFQDGDYETFRLRCSGRQISAWRGERLLALVEDGSFSSGTSGLRFSAQGGIALAYLASDSLRAHLEGQDIAGLSDQVWLGGLEVSAPRGVQGYADMQEADYNGQPLVSIRLRFSNLANTQSIALAGQNVYLTNGSQKVYALGFVPLSAGDANALGLPQTLEAGGVAAGEVFFAGVSEGDLANGWTLVVDLRYQALGEARFVLE